MDVLEKMELIVKTSFFIVKYKSVIKSINIKKDSGDVTVDWSNNIEKCLFNERLMAQMIHDEKKIINFIKNNLHLFSNNVSLVYCNKKDSVKRVNML